MESKKNYNEVVRALWHKIIYNLDVLSYEEQTYLIGYLDCVVDSDFNLALSKKFNEKLDEML